MSCSTCGTKKNADGTPAGCKKNGSCSSGGCNRLNTYNWLSDDIYFDDNSFNIIEVSFKNGVHKGFYRNANNLALEKGMLVCVESNLGYGFDIGSISLTGEVVKWQMKKRKVNENDVRILKILRAAKDAEIEFMAKMRDLENAAMIRARAIARQLNLDMKIADVEYQADGKKCTYYYIANGRVDFRELIKIYNKEFGVKVEMRQIGLRQEAALVGGIGVCGRELCCSTWLTDFKSVNTAVARYQQLAINQQKLSGQCGRLKCCLNYELDTYIDALQSFPQLDKLKTKNGDAILIKTDVFGRKMYFLNKATNTFAQLSLEEVRAVIQLNKKGEYPENLKSIIKVEEEKKEFINNTEEITMKGLISNAQSRKDREKNRERKEKQKENTAQLNNKKQSKQQQSQPEINTNTDQQVQSQSAQSKTNNSNTSKKTKNKKKKFG